MTLGATEGEPPKDTRVPEIIVATDTTELIVSDGELRWASIEGRDVFYVSNTESDLLKDIESQRYFILLSGRWFFSTDLVVPWIYVPPDHLPASVAKIPPEAEKGHLLAFVAGTEESRDAVLDHHISQTVAVKRTRGDLAVTCDGEPQVERIEGTGMAYAVNTDYSVIRVATRSYACHQAVWYVAAGPRGPWEVAGEVPEEIYTIPPAAPCTT